MFKRARMVKRNLRSRAERIMCGRSVYLACMLSFLFLAGCSPKIDVLAVSPESVSPGTIVKISLSESLDSYDYKVSYGPHSLPIIAIGDSYVTSTVPLLEPGTYEVAIRCSKNRRRGTAQEIVITPLEPAPSDTADRFFVDIAVLSQLTRKTVENIYLDKSSGGDEKAAILEGLDRCDAILLDAFYQYRNLNYADRAVINSLIYHGGYGEGLTSLAKSIVAEETTTETEYSYYHDLLSKQFDLDGLFHTISFPTLTRLDLTSATLKNMACFSRGSALAAAISIKGIPAVPVLLKISKFTGSISGAIDGLIPTDLQAFEVDIVPEQGRVLNPGETAKLDVRGTFGTQSTFSRMIISDIFSMVAGDLLAVDSEEVGQSILQELYDSILEDILAETMLDSADALFDLDSAAVPSVTVKIDPAYYFIGPGGRIYDQIEELALPTLSSARVLLQRLLGIDIREILFANEAVTSDTPSVVDYDHNSNTLIANTTGTSRLSFSFYRFDDYFNPSSGIARLGAALFPIQWAHYVTKEKLVTVSGAYDPVDSDMVYAPVGGVVPGVFTTDGGVFEISASPIDDHRRLLYETLTPDNFWFAPLNVYALNDMDTMIAYGAATVDDVETILPVDPDSGMSVAMLFDSSGSMSWNDPSRFRLDAGNIVIDMLRSGDSVAVLDFGAGRTDNFQATRLLQSFTDDRDALYNAMNRLLDAGGTPLWLSLYETLDYVYESRLPNPAILLLSDGEDNQSGSITFDNAVQRAINYGIPIYSVTLGQDLDFTEMQAAAHSTGGTATSALTAAEMTDMFEDMIVSASAGRITVSGSGTFYPPLRQPGRYYVDSVLTTEVEGLSLRTPFSFIVEVVHVKDGVPYKKVLR